MKTNGRSKLNAQQRLERDTKAVELRTAGADYDTIAQRLGYGSRSHAFEAVNNLLKERATEPAAELRQMEADRLDKLMLAHWSAATKGDIKKTEIVLRLMQRRAELLGLNRPVAIEESGEQHIVIEHVYGALPKADDATAD
jgi:hypothetical protein